MLNFRGVVKTKTKWVRCPTYIKDVLNMSCCFWLIQPWWMHPVSVFESKRIKLFLHIYNHPSRYRILFITDSSLVPRINMKAFSQNHLKSQKWELWDQKEPAAKYRVTIWCFCSFSRDRSDCSWLLHVDKLWLQLDQRVAVLSKHLPHHMPPHNVVQNTSPRKKRYRRDPPKKEAGLSSNRT